jgi:hypothetical protein
MRIRLTVWDADGWLDILAVDTRSRGQIARSRGRWDAAAGAVEAPIEVEGSPEATLVDTQPVAVVWDGDGRLDLITVDHTRSTPDAPTYTCRVWWQRNEETATAPRLGERHFLTSFENWGAADLDGTGRSGVLVTAKLPRQGRPFRTAVWYYPRRSQPSR